MPDLTGGIKPKVIKDLPKNSRAKKFFSDKVHMSKTWINRTESVTQLLNPTHNLINILN